MINFTFSRPVPILRSFNEDKTKEFYIKFLGFKLDWEHRFGPNTPLYMQLSLGEASIQISEHYGDGCPGARVRIEVNDVVKYCEVLNSKNYRHARPGYQSMSWGTTDMTIDDPSGNKITFFTDSRKKS